MCLAFGKVCIFVIHSGLANFLYKGPDSKYLRLCGPYCLLQPLTSVDLDSMTTLMAMM